MDARSTEKNEQNEITSDEYKLVSVAGKGAFADVYFGYWKNKPNTFCALKKFHSDLTFDTEKQMLTLLSNLNAPNIVKFYGSIDQPHYILAMEYMLNGDLFNFLQGDKALGLQTKYSIMSEITTAVRFLHDHKILHCDIKTNNVLLTYDLHAKLCDFGYAVNCDDLGNEILPEEILSISGTPIFMAPELLEGKYHTKMSDMYSLGLTFWEITSRKEVFHEVSTPDMLKRKKSGNPEVIPKQCPPHIAHLIQWCWEVNPSQRPTAEQTLTVINEKQKPYRLQKK